MHSSCRIGLAALLLAVAGCTPDGQKPAATAEQVRQTQAILDSAAFVPPPRSISDVTARLDSELRRRRPEPAGTGESVDEGVDEAEAPAAPVAPRLESPTQSTRRLQARPDRPAEELPAFRAAPAYAQRAASAFAEARMPEFLAARRAAAAAAREAKLADLPNYLDQLAAAEVSYGDPETAITLYTEASQLAAASRNQRGVPDKQGFAFGTAAQSVRLLASRGRIAEAEAGLVRMRQLLRQMPDSVQSDDWAARFAGVEADILSAHGKRTAAEGKLREAIRLMEAMEQRRKSAVVAPRNPVAYISWHINFRSQLAANPRDQGRYAEAEAVSRQAMSDTLEAYGPYSLNVILRGTNLAGILQEQGRFAEVEKLTGTLIEIGRRLELRANSNAMGSARSTNASAMFMQGRHADAVAAYESWQRDLSDFPRERAANFDRNRNYAASLAMVGRAGEALPILDRDIAWRQQRGSSNAFAMATPRAMRGMARAKTGDRTGALEDFRAAGVALERGPQGEAASAEGTAGAAQVLRRLAIAGMVEFYAGVPAGSVPGLDATAEAFRLADVVRGLSVQGAIEAMNTRAGVRDPALAELVRREQDIAQESVAFQGTLTNLVSLPQAQRNRNAEEAVRKRVDDLQAERTKTVEEIRQRFPAYDELRRPRPPTIANTRSRLAPNEALLSYFTTAEATYVWAVRRSGPVGFAKSAMGSAEIAAAVSALRRSLEPNAETLGDIPAFDTVLAHRLYQMLVAPVAAAIGNADTLVIAPHGILGELPLGLLVTKPTPVPADRPGETMFAAYAKVPWLVRDAAIVQVPSVAAFQTLRAIPAPAAGRRAFAGFGDPWFNPQQAAEGRAASLVAVAPPAGPAAGMQTRGIKLALRSAPLGQSVDSAEIGLLARLPDTADEIRAVAKALGAGSEDQFLGDVANERRVRTMNLADRRVVMFATHGLIPGDLNGLQQPALALTAPSVAGNDGGDGLLTMDDILSLRLDADWVVLSACNTASGNGAGAEAVSGLGRAFFYAGARALLVSNWPVETTSARELTSDLFARQAADPRLSRAAALQKTMLGLIDGPGAIDPATRRPVFAYSHPIFWAPFSLVGDGG